MSRKALHTLLMGAILLLVVWLLVKHFKVQAMTPMPSSNGLLGD